MDSDQAPSAAAAAAAADSDPADDLEQAEPAEDDGPHAPDQPSSGGAIRRALAQRRRALPWSDGAILLGSLVLVVVLLPLWLDPLTLSQVAGQVASYPPVPTPSSATTPTDGARTPGPSLPQTLIATDDFARTQFEGWGSADLGGQYVASGTGVLSVEEGLAFVHLRPPDAGVVLLPALVVDDVALEIAMSVDTIPADGQLAVFALLRAADDRSAYRLGLHLDAAGEVEATVDSLVDGRSRRIGSGVLIPITPSVAPPAIRLRVEAVGSDPTTLRLRAWADGDAEPAGWQLSVIDWTGALQASGSAGVAWRLESAIDAQLALAFDQINVWHLTGVRP